MITLVVMVVCALHLYVQSGTTAVGSTADANCSQHIGECSVSTHSPQSTSLSLNGLQLSDTCCAGLS